ncbi:hypothetical protein LQZ19_10475 [Treponema primitia]|uniref:hypothetical protein n=1 Tax=Treponema primitia TaxID=88058 RepID=UPI00397FE546
MHRLRVFFLYFAVLLACTRCGNPLNAVIERVPLTPSIGDPETPLIPDIPKIIDGNYSARILVTNLIKDQNITGISTEKTTYPDPILEDDQIIKPGHEKSAWVEFDSKDVSFTFYFAKIDDPFTKTSETFEKALHLYKDGFTRIYLYRTTGGAISISPDPSPDDKEPGTPLPIHDSYIDVYNLTKLITINEVTFDPTADPESLGPIEPGTEGITSVENGIIQLTIDYGDPAEQLIKPIAVLPGIVTNVYFYKAKDGTFKAEDVRPADDKLYNETPAVPASSIPGPDEGNSPGTINSSNSDSLGLLVVRNLSKSIDVDSATFTANFLSDPPAYTMVPGPKARSERSILLGPGEWSIVAVFNTTETTPAAITKTIKTYTAAPGPQYVYFYKDNTGQYAIGTDDTMPTNLYPDENIEDPDDLVTVGMGKLNIINSSVTNDSIIKVEINDTLLGWTEIDFLGSQIYAGSQLFPDNLSVPTGTQEFRFTLSSKPYSHSNTVSKSIPQYNPAKPDTIAAITYIDQMSQNVEGMGTLIIANSTTGTNITKVVAFTPSINLSDPAALVNSEYYVDPDTPMMISSGNSGSMMLSSGGASQSYIVRLYINANVHIDKFIKIKSQEITRITLYDTDLTESSAEGSDPSFGTGGKGSLVVKNAYSGKIPMKIFKIQIYELTSADDPGGSPSAYSYDETPDYLGIGDQWATAELPSGKYYRIKVIAGAYTWDHYVGDGGAGIIYDWDVVFIQPHTRRIVEFNPVGKEIPAGDPVKVVFHNSDISNLSNVIRIQVTSENFGGISLIPLLTVSPQRNNIVYEYNGSILASAPNNTFTFYLLPGKYKIRVQTDVSIRTNTWYGKISMDIILPTYNYLVVNLNSTTGTGATLIYSGLEVFSDY